MRAATACLSKEYVVSPDADERQLVAACKAGDRTAFRILYERYQRRIYAVAFGYVRNQEDALDVVQEAFVKVHKHIERFEGQSSFYTWLYRITANACIDLLRKRRGKALEYDDAIRHDGGPATQEVFRSLAPMGDPGQSVQNEEILRAVQAGLAELSEKHRMVIVMRELQGMSYAEIAKAMNCSKGTIMSRLFHARKNLQALLVERIDYGPAGDAQANQAPDESSPPVVASEVAP